MSRRKIRASDSVEELIERYPGLVGFLMDHGIVCIKCGEPYWGALGDLIRNKGKDADSLIATINDRFAEET